MPSMAVYDQTGAKTAEMDVADDILGVAYNPDLVHQAVLYVDAHRKRKCGKAKTRGEVDATGTKWYRQKGLGRARHGARSAPTFVGGGKAHGPTGEQRSYKMPRKMRRKALCCALSERARRGRLTVVDALALEAISTKAFVQVLADLKLDGRILMLLGPDEARDEILHKSSRNVPSLLAREAPHLNTRDVLWAEEILITRAGLAQLMGGDVEDAE
jgi:large subunit ribosomal protein L4